MLAALACAAPAQAQAPAAPSRGELLYNNHCIECHTSQIHWRDGKQVRDWAGLRAKVRFWQANAGLRWDDADITDVARYLDNTIYRLTPGTQRVGRAGEGAGVRRQPAGRA
ncbi:cytochrome c [Caenimonas aquaedulcis]|uniref:Cytochrome c n=1 Tax=Caenimonas aquaedulcis TaxID=2793270 RepID=A0A931H883_9BURK|nr:cytochrome c [Caenimonas aquaedulcis]MBG9390202.1 cytochrome c [Caenimonas aquaedulcis]